MNPPARARVPASALFLVRPRLPHWIHRIGSWKRGAAGSGELQETRAGRDSRSRDRTQPESEVDGDATSSGLARQAESRNSWASGTPGGTDQASGHPLHGHRLGDGDVVEKRFAGPVPGVGGHAAVGLVGRGSEAGCCGGGAHVAGVISAVSSKRGDDSSWLTLIVALVCDGIGRACACLCACAQRPTTSLPKA